MRRPRAKSVVRWLCTAALALVASWWVFSGWYSISWWTSGHYVTLSMGSVVCASGAVAAQPPGAGIVLNRVLKPPSTARWNWRARSAQYPDSGVAVGHGRVLALSRPFIVNAPTWPLIVVLAAISFWLWRGQIRERANRRKKWCCPECGYDRRGLASADTACPECGHSPGVSGRNS